MAMVFHCLSFLSQPNSSGFSTWPQLRPRRFHFRGDLVLPGQDAVGKLSKIFWVLPQESSIHQLFSEVHKSKPGDTCFDLSEPVPEKDLRSLSVNQLRWPLKWNALLLSMLQGAMVVRLPATTLLLANSLLLVMPSEVLAETCEADSSFFNMPLLLLVALVGATVGGLLARQRRGELQRLNEQLRQINAALKRQAKIESYAPNLSYAPVGVRIPETEVFVDPKKPKMISHLKTGKNYLRNQEPQKAFMEFKEALELAKTLNDPIEEKKAARGLGASLQRQGKYSEAIKYHSMVLSISKRVGESSGDTEAYGAIADCYAELGDLENAGKFYDKYIALLEAD